MLYLDKLLTQIAYPLSLSLLPLLLLWRHWRRSDLTILVLAVAWLWVWSLPVVVVSGGVANGAPRRRRACSSCGPSVSRKGPCCWRATAGIEKSQEREAKSMRNEQEGGADG